MSNLSEDEINAKLAGFESTFTQCEYNSAQVQNRLNAFREWATLKFQQLQRKSDAETLRSEIETKQKEVNDGFTCNLAELSAQIDQLRLEVQASMNNAFILDCHNADICDVWYLSPTATASN